MNESVTAEYVIEVKETRYRGGTGIAFGERRERIVRCRDCRFCKRSTPVYIADGKTYTGDFWLCEAVCETEWPGHRFQVSPDGFCAWGVPRDGSER